jgi:microcystin-dependent protein
VSKITQFVGHTADVANAFIGAPRELTVDISNNNVRVHDGVTAGGTTLVTAAWALTRFQASSAELSAFSSFGTTARGILCRVGAGSVVLRAVTGTEGQLTVTNPAGIAGDIRVELNEVITTPHQFTNNVLFSSTIEAENGINGNTAGIHVGPVEGDVIGNLQGNSEGNHVGGLDARGESVFFDPDQIPLNAIEGLTAAITAQLLPAGTIIPYVGSITPVPSGWALCNGTLGTPDLRGKFLRCYATGLNPGVTGGAETHGHGLTLANSPGHTHDVTVTPHALTVNEMPAHKHGNGITDSGAELFNHGTLAANPTTSDSVDNNSADGTVEGYTTEVGGGAAHTHLAVSAAGGVHSHAGVVTDGNGLPPFYVVYYLMKL